MNIINKNNILLFIILILIIIFQSCASVHTQNKFISISKEWNYNFFISKTKDFSDLKLIKSGTTDLPINFGKLIEPDSIEKGMVEFTKVIKIDYDLIKDSKFIGIYFGKLIDCSEIFINDELVSRNGIFKNKYFTAWNKNILVKLPNFTKIGIEEISIKMRIFYYPDGSVQDDILLGDYEKLRKIERINNIIDVDFKIILLFISLLFVILFFYIGVRLKYTYYIYFSLLTFQISLFTIIYVLTDLPIDHTIFNYLFEYKSMYLSSILLILFTTEYLNKKPDIVLKIGIIFSCIGFLLDTLIYKRTIRLSIYQIFNILLYLIFAYLIIYVLINFIKTKSKNSKDILFSLLILFLTLTNDLLSFKYPSIIKNLYPNNITLKYLNIYGFQFFIVLIATRLVRDLVNSFYKLRILTKDLDKISSELEKRNSMLTNNVQKLLDNTKESFIISEKLSNEGNDFSKVVFNLKDQIEQMKESLILSATNEEKISQKTSQLFEMLENVQQGYNTTNKILEKVIEKIDEVILNTNLIDTIVEQTSLLSLNSSVVAGKAKEKGRGFSIISDEIRKLALKSADFSSNAHEGINNILKSVEETRNRSQEFLKVFTEYIEQYNKLVEYLKINQENHNVFNIKISEMIEIIGKISLLADEIDEKSRKLYIISNENINANMEL